METQSVTIPIDPSTAALLDAIRVKTEARGGSLDALLEPMSRRVLELVAIEAHQADLITEQEMMDILGFEDREELWEFFKRYDVRSKHTSEDFKKGRATMSALLAQHG
jgi:hypothetical protein